MTLNSYTLLRAVALDFPKDPTTHELTDQFLFGPALLVCPVTRPMYYQRNSEPIKDAQKSRLVYLPADAGWFDFWTERIFTGGQAIEASAPLETLPIFVRAGSILPMSPVMQFTDEIPNAPYEIRVYRGQDAEFCLYEDAGDNYDYEQGQFAFVKLVWNEHRAELVIGRREGTYVGLVRSREFNLVFISDQRRVMRQILYLGDELTVSAA